MRQFEQEEQIEYHFKISWAGGMFFSRAMPGPLCLHRAAAAAAGSSGWWYPGPHSSFHHHREGRQRTTTSTTTTTCISKSFPVSTTTKDTRTLCTTTTSTNGVKPPLGDTDHPPLYLHVGPSGDCWTGPSLFAAKHLPPDYVKSVLLDESLLDVVDRLLELLEGGGDDDVEEGHGGSSWTRIIYDEGVLPPDLLVRLRESS